MNEVCRVCGKEITNNRWCIPICSDECFTKDFWNQKVARKKDKHQVVINGWVYYIADENAAGSRGFDGAVHYIKFFDGREVRTTNLWSNGEMPEEYRKKLPDNANWMTKEEVKKYDKEHPRADTRDVSLGFLFPLQ